MSTSTTLTRLAKTKISESINHNLNKHAKTFIPLANNAETFSSCAHDLILPNVKQDFIKHYATYQKYNNKKEIYETLDLSEILNLVTEYYDFVLPKIYLKFRNNNYGVSIKKKEYGAPSTIRISSEDRIILSKWHNANSLHNNNLILEQMNKPASAKQIRYIKIICRTLDMDIPNINSSAEASSWISTYQNAFNHYSKHDRIDPYLFEKF